MKVRFACISAGLALAATTTQVSAADFGGRAESYQNMGAVAVPAPVPVPQYRGGWYFRFDAGIGDISEPDVSEKGFIYGEADGPGPLSGPADPRTSLSSWFDNDFNTFTTFGGGVGYDFGGGFRIDGTVEYRSKDHAKMIGEDHWDSYAYNCAGCYQVIDANTNGIADQKTNIYVTDNTRLTGTIWMLNGYYDLFSRGGFTPYVGGGVGFVWNKLERLHNSVVTTCDNESVPVCASETEVSNATVRGHADVLSFAAAAMAGVSYDISDITTLDLGYRFLYMGGSDIGLTIGGDQSTLSIGDQFVHQFRAGVRFNVN